MGGRVVKYKISTYEIMFAVPEILPGSIPEAAPAAIRPRSRSYSSCRCRAS